ncbi:MAG: helix-hairpin-helix domain-containing protein [bacterium]
MRSILCIDIKSFFASCECLLLNKDPFTTPLIVASQAQKDGAITLAITPYMKSLGVKSRCRVYEIPRNIKYILKEPKMSFYQKMSKEVISIYLDFVSKEDIHVYSIDEAFLDVTNYLNYYNMTDYELAQEIMNTVFKKTGLYASCGIGENMFIAKSAMDIDAKQNKDNIAKWSMEEAKIKLKKITKLTDMWGIGPNTARKLNSVGIFSIKDLAEYDKDKLIKKFGIIGEELWSHANGQDDAIISDNTSLTKNLSYGTSQMLFKDYDIDSIQIILKESINTLVARLRTNNKMCKRISVGIGYTKSLNKGFYHSITMDNYTRDSNKIFEYSMFIIKEHIEDYPIRKISISFGTIISQNSVQHSLFDTKNSVIKNDNLNTHIDSIHSKYGKNSVINAAALLEDSTLIERNKKIGGHKA